MKTDLMLVLALCAACGKSEPSNEGKRMPAPPPPVKAEIPANLSIAVTIDGTAKAPITKDTLTTMPPDWSDPQQRRAWKISRLVGVEDSPQISFAVTGTSSNITIELPAVQTENPLVPCLVVSQRGTIVAEYVDPKDPFPRFHGEGGRLGRSPESEPRVNAVTKIEVHKR
jgi:hypothetical protein